MVKAHTFHIPVMGIAYTIDTPLKVSQYGIDSVISLVDDILLEKLRKMYCEKFKIPFKEITNKVKDFRAKRITSYLNLLNDLTKKRFEDIKNAVNKKELKKYIDLLSEKSEIKKKLNKINVDSYDFKKLKIWLAENISIGNIDVNIMTKLDKENYLKGEKLPDKYNDAHAALRGFAMSDLSSSIILSAGMNPKLYSYIEQFEDFYPDYNGNIKKKIVLKVSDYRSALIQGKFLAKKGLWVSEYRIESGLNCGGHAFATNGLLMGPILEAFKENRNDLITSVHQILINALSDKNRVIPQKKIQLKITAQGGVGTAEEHNFLINEYNLDSIGWGSPFLLVPEATTIDKHTMNQLIEAKEKDLYLSNISPLGVPFNSLRGNTKDLEKRLLINKGKPGSACPKKYLSLNNELGGKHICTASRKYQYKKLKELEKEDLTPKELHHKKRKIFEKSCICVGLGTSALLVNNIDTTIEGKGVSVCPGPNMAYFSKEMSLKEMVNHIYNKNEITNSDRPNMFIKELNIYIEYIKNKVKKIDLSSTDKQKKYLQTFVKNLQTGINYYLKLFTEKKEIFENIKTNILQELSDGNKILNILNSEIENTQITEKELVLA
ncbi:MAG: hypothetical protein L3J35_04640 [Bacteroidales bacterium]|nr:hypothetical protein [Bacteroidales bacterium]